MASLISASHLSSQLQAHGYISRPLDCFTLLSSSSSSSSSNEKNSLAKVQLEKCLWGMLNSRVSQQSVVETLAGENRRMEGELERTRNALKASEEGVRIGEKERSSLKARNE